MTRPVKEDSISGATSATAGSKLETAGRFTVSMWVVANSGDTANDTVDVDLEVSMDGTNWTKPRDEDGNIVGQLTAADLEDPDGNGNSAGLIKVHGLAAQYVRPRITTLADSANGDLSVDVVVAATSPSQTSYDYRTTR